MLLRTHLLALWASLGALQVVGAASTDDVDTTICGALMAQATSGGQDSYFFYAVDVYDCLRSIPFYSDPALRFLNYYNTTLQFQSTLAFLKTPPGGYQQPAIDVGDILHRIENNVTAGAYRYQYEFEVDLQKLVLAIHDAHVNLDIGITSPFVYGSPYSISSVSLDGKEPPKIYLTEDIQNAQLDGWSWTPSPISQINDIDVVEFLTDFASLNSVGYVENHAEWNALMGHPAQDIQGWPSVCKPLETVWISFYTYPRETGPIATVGDMYNFFALGLYPSVNGSAAHPAAESNTVAKKRAIDDVESVPSGDDGSWYAESNGAYPKHSDVHQSDLLVSGGGVVTGYYLHELSTGVLSLPTFSQYGDYLRNFTQSVQEFVEGAARNNLSKIIIDLQQNSGGQVVLVMDTFLRFFPGREPFFGSRRRSHRLANIVGNATTSWWNTLNATSDEDYSDWEAGLVDEWVITPRVNTESKKNFASWDEYAGPKHYLGDEFTLVEKYNLTDDYFIYEMFAGNLPLDYLVDTGNTYVQHWEPKDVVLLTDGLCSSACALFVELMTRKGARTVVMGGRPDSGPMQAASGSRGARAYSSTALDADFAVAGIVDEVANQTLPNIPSNGVMRDPGLWSSAYFNLRDQIREEELKSDAAVPLQFRYEAADCRLYYTLRNLYNMTQQWTDVHEAVWGEGPRCVAGSTGYSTTPGQQSDPSKKPPPVSPLAEQHRPFPKIYTPPSANSSSEASLPHFAPEDITASHITYDEPIHRCDELNRCDGALQCKEVYVRCHKGGGMQGPSNKVMACLPACYGPTGCDVYNSNMALTCQPFVSTELKQATQLQPLSDKSRQRRAAPIKQQYSGLCQPTFGTKLLGNCPI
ncbi:Peptidase S41 family protein ustP [Apiospora kogelbergensis]|uniref:Peptidase S41 family protein ustP n=1 Tax=Apiospora kogelbergensis TaxID=1337665 RepID=UPI00312D44A0